jgi:hypothetical protein
MAWALVAPFRSSHYGGACGGRAGCRSITFAIGQPNTERNAGAIARRDTVSD